MQWGGLILGLIGLWLVVQAKVSGDTTLWGWSAIVGSLVGITVRAGQLAADHPELVDIDLNPVITTAAGCCVTDAVILVAPVGRATTAIRRL